jgi:thioredoxin-like negative regulator of GroEL
MKSRKLLRIGLVVGLLAVLAAGMSMSMISQSKYEDHGGLEWRTNLDAGLDTAAQQDDPVVVYYWLEDCGTCESFEEGLKTDGSPPVLEEEYVRVAVEADENQALMDRYSVEATPTLVVLSPNGTKVTAFNPQAVEDLEGTLEAAHDRAADDTDA